MLFNSFIYILFLILIVVVYYIIPVKRRNYFLLAINYIFYCYFNIWFALLLLILTSSTYLIGNKLLKLEDEREKKHLLTGIVIINLLVLGVFKYFNFFISVATELLTTIGIQNTGFSLDILMPLGISFYIFQSLTFVFDIYYGSLKEKYSFVEFAVFASFFPTVVAGPIERASNLLYQIRSDRKFDSQNISEGISLIVIGLFRKVLIGDTVGRIVNHIYADPQYFTSLEILIAIFLYSIQIYNDFAGYSNIAKGSAKLLGINIMINFKQPYFASSVADFWRRWHISLSTWLRDYLFMPLQLKYRNLKIWGNILAIMITFTLCGLWHGASWNFVLWGFLHGFYMSFAIIFRNEKKLLANIIKNVKVMYFLRSFMTFILITFSWILFRTTDFNETLLLLSKLFEFSTGEFSFRFLKIFFVYTTVSFILDYLEVKWKSDSILSRLNKPIRYAVILTLLMIVFSYMLTSDKAPFIYARF